jgi:hypothetical protein
MVDKKLHIENNNPPSFQRFKSFAAWMMFTIQQRTEQDEVKPCTARSIFQLNEINGVVHS